MNLPAGKTLYAGIDEAGRGCVIGPLVVAIVAAEPKDRAWFALQRVRDSKLMEAGRRDDLAKRIRERCWHALLIAEPHEIDDALYDPGRSLNELEMEMMIALMRHFQSAHADRPARILADAISSNANAIRERFVIGSHGIDAHRIDARHKADRDDRTVAAASIIAKAERERLIEIIKNDVGHDFGSGYSHDERTRDFLKTCAPDAPYVRWSWKTARDSR